MTEPSTKQTNQTKAGMEDRPPVTVVIPCFRQAHYLKECIASVVAQTYENWKVIVVDDESPDHDQMQRVIDGFNEPRIRIIRHEKNGGLAAARNTGIEESGTELVLPLDSDDKIEPDCLESMVPVMLADRKLDCVFADVQRFGRSAELTEFHGPPIGEKVVRVEDTLPGAGTMMRRGFWARVGGYDEAHIMRRGREDFEFYIRAFSVGCRAAHVAKPLYLYRISHSSMVTAAAAHDDEIFDYIYNKHRKMFESEEEGASFLSAGYDSAALGSHRDGRRWRSVRMAFKAWKTLPTGSRARAVMRSFMSPQLHASLRNGWSRTLATRSTGGIRAADRVRPRPGAALQRHRRVWDLQISVRRRAVSVGGQGCRFFVARFLRQAVAVQLADASLRAGRSGASPDPDRDCPAGPRNLGRTR